MVEFLAAAASSDTGVNPLFFVLGGLALLVVCCLGPLSRIHERRGELKAARQKAEQPAAGEPSSPPTDH